MKFVAIAIVVVLAVLGQVTVASLFPISGAVADFPLVTLLLLSVFAGPRTVLIALPFAAIMLGFVSDRAPGLLLLAYLPLPPLALFLDESPLPLNHYARTALTCLGVGLWLRLVLALGAVAQGADMATAALIRDVMLPGAFLDLALLTVAYIPCRFIGWTGRGTTLQRSGW
jgi:hypothetical protein